MTLNPTTVNAQINLGEKGLVAIHIGVTAYTFSDAEATKLPLEAVRKTDSTNVVAHVQ